MRRRPGAPVASLGEGAALYGKLGRCYALVRSWPEAKERYEAMLGEAREADDKEAEWEALTRLAMLGTDFTDDPEADDELFRGVRKRVEQEAEEGSGGEESRPPGEPKPFEWSPKYALERAGEALSLARELGRDYLVANSTTLFALLKLYAGRWEGVAAGAAEARALFAAMGDRAMEAEVLNLSAWGEFLAGRLQEALRIGRERLAATRELGDQEIHVADLHGLVLALLEMGEYGEALSVARTGMQAARSLGSSERLWLNLVALGDARAALFRLEEARAAYSETGGVVNVAQHRALTHSKLCAVAALEGDWQEAHAQALEAAKLRGEVVLQFTAALHFHHEIEALLRGGEEDFARKELRRFAEAIGENRRLRVAHLRARAVPERWAGEAGSAVESLREAEALAEEIGLPRELWEIRAELGEIYEERGETEEARRAFAAAAAGVQGLAEGISDGDLRKSFLDARRVRRVLEFEEGIS